ncbi:DUF4412 domain-containing protein [bacterium]|nr:DUF4412 domain-containing protein [bacterium]
MFTYHHSLLSSLCFSLLLIVLLMSTPAACQSGKLTEFTADQVTIGPDGTEKVIGKLFVAPQKSRMEMNMEGGMGKMITITLMDQQKMYMIMPDKKKYTENTLSESELQGMMMDLKNMQEVVELGSETVNGYKCTKKQTTTTTSFMGKSIQSKVIVWTSDQFDIPIRTQNDKGEITEMRNIKEGKQAKELFEIPSGYNKAKNMMDLMMP